eukprot:8707184-Prorocentrum_lima.AAC.1
MTSSLVGSEMCIRDSLCHSNHIAKTCTIWSKPHEMCGKCFVDLDYLCGTVSYTHLTLPTICSV